MVKKMLKNKKIISVLLVSLLALICCSCSLATDTKKPVNEDTFDFTLDAKGFAITRQDIYDEDSGELTQITLTAKSGDWVDEETSPIYKNVSLYYTNLTKEKDAEEAFKNLLAQVDFQPGYVNGLFFGKNKDFCEAHVTGKNYEYYVLHYYKNSTDKSRISTEDYKIKLNAASTNKEKLKLEGDYKETGAICYRIRNTICFSEFDYSRLGDYKTIFNEIGF